MEADIKAYLADDAGVMALLADPLSQICQQVVPEGMAFPNIRFFKVSAPRGRHLTGPDGTVEARVQFDCRGLSADSAKSLFTAVREALQGLDGQTIGSTNIMATSIDDERDHDEQFADGSDDAIFITSADAFIFYRE